MNRPDLEAMNRQELARYMVANRDTQEAEEARRIYLRRFEEKARACGIELRRSTAKTD